MQGHQTRMQKNGKCFDISAAASAQESGHSGLTDYYPAVTDGRRGKRKQEFLAAYIGIVSVSVKTAHGSLHGQCFYFATKPTFL